MAIGDGKNGFLTVPSGGAVSLQPPSGEEWLVRDVASTAASGYPTGFSLGLYDGTNYSMVRPNPSGALWSRKLELFTTHSCYMRLVDVDTSADTVGYNAIVTAVSGTAAGRGDAKTAISSVVASGTLSVQPSAGQSWSLLEAGSDQTAAGSTGNVPDVKTELYDGSTSALVFDKTSNSPFRPWLAVLTNATYARITNTNASTANISYSAVRMS